MLYLLFLLWPVASIVLFFFIIKRWGKKNHVALSIFYALTFLLPMVFEKAIEKIVRHKYHHHTIVILNSLNKKHFKYHVVFGTFLFAYRNQNFKDMDLDLGVYADEWNHDQEKILNELGFFRNEMWSLDDEVREINFVNSKDHISLDIYLIQRRPDFSQAFDEKNKRYARRPTLFQYEIAPYEVAGVKFFGPAQAEAYLTWVYGEWKKPDPNYHWFRGSQSSPPIVVHTDKIKYEKY